MSGSKFYIIIPPQDVEDHPGYLERMSAGDRAAFEWLYKHYSARLYEYVRILTGDAYRSEDIVQEVFLKLWKNREDLARVKNFNGYIYSMAKNLVLNLQKREKVEACYLEETWRCHQWQCTVVPVEEKEKVQLVLRAMCSLSDRQRLFLRLTREEERSHQEISKAYSVSKHTVKNTIIKAREKLRRFIEVKGG